MTKAHAHILAVKLLATSALAFLQFYLASKLSIKEYGTYSLVMSLNLVLVSAAVWGLDRYTVKLVSVNAGEGRKVNLNYYIRVSKVILTNILLIYPAGIYVIYRSIDDTFDSFTTASLFLLLTTGSAALIISSASKGAGKVIASEFYYNFLRPFIAALGVVGIILTNGHISANQALLLMVFAQLLVTILMWAKLVKKTTDIENNRISNNESLYRRGLPFLMMGLGLPYLANVDILILGLLDTEDSVGMYSIASKIVGLALMGLVSANLLIMPKIAHFHNVGQTIELQRIVKQNNIFIIVVTTPVIAALYTYAETLLGFIASEYTNATTIIHILLIGQIINILTGPVSLICAMAGQQKVAAKILVLMCVIQTMLCIVMIPRYGAHGAAASNLAVNILFNLSLMFVVRKNLSIDPSTFSIFTGRITDPTRD